MTPRGTECKRKVAARATGHGPSATSELIDLGVEHGVVEKSGAWFSLDGERLGQGKEKAMAALRENEAQRAGLAARVREAMGVENAVGVEEAAVV